MKRKGFFGKLEPGIFVLLLTACIVYGLMGRFSYTNIYQQDNLDDIQVAEFPDDVDSAKNLFKNLSALFQEAPYIVGCRVLDDPEVIYQSMRVRVRVTRVFEGNELAVDDEIWLTKGSWFFVVDEDGSAHLNLGYHNLMKKGQEYLVFMEEHLDVPEEKYGVVYSLVDTAIAPVFNYTDGEKVCIPVGTDNTSVPYRDVQNNEYFCVEEEVMELMLAFKREMLGKYQ